MTQATPSFETLRYAVEDGVATITLHRPDRLNAFTAQMMQDLIAAFDATDADDNVRAVIVTGAGRAFCAGADLSGGSSTFDFEKRYGASPDTASVVRACATLGQIAGAFAAPTGPSFEWDEPAQTLVIADPYLQFYLRWSIVLEREADALA